MIGEKDVESSEMDERNERKGNMVLIEKNEKVKN